MRTRSRCLYGAGCCRWPTCTRARCGRPGTSCVAGYFSRKRAELLTHIQNTASQCQLPTLGKIAYHGNRGGLAEQFGDPEVRTSIETNLALIDEYDRRLTALELHLTETAKVHDVNAFYRLRSVPGIGGLVRECVVVALALRAYLV